MSTPQLIIALITFFLTFASGLSFAVWTLSNKISDNTRTITSHVVETRVELNTKISSLDKGLVVLQTSEAARDEKIARMWDWWMQALTEGWTSHMRAEKHPSDARDIGD